MNNALNELIENTNIKQDNRLMNICKNDFLELQDVFGDEIGTTFKNFSHAESGDRIYVDDYTGETIII